MDDPISQGYPSQLEKSNKGLEGKLTFGAFNLVSFDDQFFLDWFHGVDLVVANVVDKIHFAIWATPNNFQDLKIRFCHFRPKFTQVI